MRITAFILVVLFSLSSEAFTLSDNYKNGWRTRQLKFNFNLTNCPSAVLSAFADAADLWNSVSTSSLKIKKNSLSATTTPAALVAGTATDSPVIVCDNAFGATTGADQDAVAGVGFSAIASGTYINYGGLILNTSAGAASVSSMSKTTLAVVLAHEIGHVLGFGHSEDAAALMYFSVGYKKHLRLSQDDWDALTYLYPRDELKTDDLFGCGSIGNAGTTPPVQIILSLMLFAMPALIVASLRRRTYEKLVLACVFE